MPLDTFSLSKLEQGKAGRFPGAAVGKEGLPQARGPFIEGSELQSTFQIILS